MSVTLGDVVVIRFMLINNRTVTPLSQEELVDLISESKGFDKKSILYSMGIYNSIKDANKKKRIEKLIDDFTIQTQDTKASSYDSLMNHLGIVLVGMNEVLGFTY